MMTVDLNNIPEEIMSLPDSSFEQASNEDIFDEAFQTEHVGFFKDAMIRLRKNKVSVMAMIIILLVAVLAIVAPSFNEYTYIQQNTTMTDMPPRIPGLEKIGIADGSRVLTNRKKSSVEDESRFPPGSILEITNEKTVSGSPVVDVKVNYYAYKEAGDTYFWFGSDYLGRDLFTRLFRGARVSLLIAVVAVLSSVIFGVIYGALAGYYGGKVDMLMMRAAEILEGIPYLVVVMMFMILLGAGMRSIIIALAATGWMGTSRLIRAQFYRFKGREYVLAARTLGVPDRTLIFRHILPNSIGPIITRAMIAIPGAIFSESFLAYIGLGLQAPEPSIGIMLADGQKVLLQYPYQTLFPALLISILMISFNLLANGLRDALDPTQRGGE